jgi:hypothetical protein
MSKHHFLLASRSAASLGSGILVIALAGPAAAQSGRTTQPPTAYGSVMSGDTPPRAIRGSPRSDPFALDVMASTLIPLSIGPEVSVELPGRILAQAHLGWMPELYSQTLTDSLEDAGVYDDTVGALIDGAMQGATAFRLAAGWRPFASAGLELTLGYAYVSLDGATTTGELRPLVSEDVAERLDAEVGNVGLTLESSIHHLTVAAGWRWLVAERVVIRANLGYMQAIDSSSTFEIASFPELTRLAEPTVDSVLHDHYTRYITIPVVGLAVGYRFF